MSNIDIVIKIVSLVFMFSVTMFVVYSIVTDIIRRTKDPQHQCKAFEKKIDAMDIRLESLEESSLRRLDEVEEDIQYLQSGIFSEAFDCGPVSLDSIRLELLNRITTLECHIFPNEPEEQVKFNVADLEKRVKALEKKVKANE